LVYETQRWEHILVSWIRLSILLFTLVSVLAGCAALPPGRTPDPHDPFERYNRAAFSFNDVVDRAVLKPVSQAYRAVTPVLLQRGIANFFGNLSDVPTALNDILQGKPKMAATHVGRFAVNSTFGLLGIFDIATPMGMSRQREDFGQTLGTWGFGSGPYLVLPILGPSSVRDTFGTAIDIGLDPLIHVKDGDWRLGLVGLRVIQQRAALLDPEKTLKSIELDPYLFIRDAYLSRRRNNVYDGNPPEPKEERGQELRPGDEPISAPQESLKPE